MHRSDIEIMAPAGSREALVAAAQGGADAVYFGVGRLNMRSKSSANFTTADLPDIVSTAHKLGMRAYLTVNTVVYDNEMEEMHRLMDSAKAADIDAVIVSDQSAIMYASSIGLEIHISTQLNVSNLETLRFYAQWADVVVLARELSLDAIAYIYHGILRDNICGPSGKLIKIEMFAHGALCMAVSGKCYLSLHESGNSANRGACRQICRRSYTLTDTETGDQIEVQDKYLLSPKDLCTMPFLDRFIAAGVSVLKIEGRARSEDYVKRTCECYDEAVRAIAEGAFTEELAERLTLKLGETFNRGFWGGYYLGSPVVELSAKYGSSATKRRVYVGKVTNFFKRIGVAEILVEASPLESGSEIIITGATTGVMEMTASEIFVDERPATIAPQGKYCSIKTTTPVHRGDKLYKIVDTEE
jgi:putative protease